jgi:hypothetical protein
MKLTAVKLRATAIALMVGGGIFDERGSAAKETAAIRKAKN